MTGHGILTFGASAFEAEPIGEFEVQQRPDGAISVTVTFRPENLVRELLHGGMMPEPKPPSADQQARDAWRRLAQQRVDNFRSRAGEQLRIWLTTTLAWDDLVRGMTDADFLHWFAEFPPRQVPRVLSVPAVQERIGAIRQKTAAWRRRLADIFAVHVHGRPLAVPPDNVLRTEVRLALVELEPFLTGVRSSRRRDALRTAIKHQNPDLMRVLEALKCSTRGRERVSLADLWFGDPVFSLNQMGCQFVAAQRGLSWQTVEKFVGRENARREPKHRSKPDPEAVEAWRRAVVRASQFIGAPDPPAE